jgi:hypothetical protein
MSTKNDKRIDDERIVDDELTDSGIAIVGDVNLELVGKVKAQLEFPDIKKRHHRQTELQWNSVCSAVIRDFETVSEKARIYIPVLIKLQKLKPNITALRAKPCQNRRFVYFHKFPTSSGTYKPENSAGKHTVAIVIRDGPGLPFIYKGSHKSNGLDPSTLGTPFTNSAGEAL